MSYLALVGAPAEKSRSQDGNWANENQRHPDFGFHVWHEVGNRSRSVGAPINKAPDKRRFAVVN
jgi:hypothetical protein